MWIESDDWILLNVEQGSDLWHQYKRGRVTGTVVYNINGHGGTFNGVKTSPDDEVLYSNGSKKKVFDEVQLHNMAQGVLREPLARAEYCRIYQVQAVEVGLVMPKIDVRFGSSVDGIVISTEADNLKDLVEQAAGIIEIKSPVRMYGKSVV